MKLELQIKSADDVRKLRTNINGLKLQLLQFQALTVRKLANSVILDTIHQRMRDENFSEKIVINTIVSNIEFITKTKVRIHFTSEYFSETGFDVALAREKGTKTHKVQPKYLKELEPEKVFENLGVTDKKTKQALLKTIHPRALRWIQEGKVLFSKGHLVTGMKSLHIIAKTLDELQQTLQLKYNQELSHWVSDNLKAELI